jgi:hypothetical protein
MNYNPNSSLKATRIMAVLMLLFTFLIANIGVVAQDATSKKTNKKVISKTESIVREGKINLQKIDKNKDGKVFQCPMDWNVISDKAAKCPKCKMDLSEVTIQKAKENLIKNGFKVK